MQINITIIYWRWSMLIFTCSKPTFIKLLLLFIVMLTSSINIAQTKEKIDIDSEAKELGITTTELQGILNSALRNGEGGDQKPDTLTKITITGQAAGDNFGYSVSTAGDVNGDGYSDVIVGAPYNHAGGFYAGRAYISFGGTSMDSTIDVTMTGEAADDWFGTSVSTAGDVNGDGYSDVIVGAPLNAAGGFEAGRAYVYFIYQSANYVKVDFIINNYSLRQNYPNPFNPATTITYQIPERSFVTLKVYDILGNEVATLVNEEKPAGSYEVEWNALSLPSGIYFYQLRANNFIESKKMILLK